MQVEAGELEIGLAGFGPADWVSHVYVGARRLPLNAWDLAGEWTQARHAG